MPGPGDLQDASSGWSRLLGTEAQKWAVTMAGTSFATMVPKRAPIGCDSCYPLPAGITTLQLAMCGAGSLGAFNPSPTTIMIPRCEVDVTVSGTLHAKLGFEALFGFPFPTDHSIEPVFRAEIRGEGKLYVNKVSDDIVIHGLELIDFETLERYRQLAFWMVGVDEWIVRG